MVMADETAPEPLKPEKCIWKRDPDGESYVWVIGCTNEFSIEPDAEEYGYCVECGRGIELVTAPLEDHEGRWPQRDEGVRVAPRDEAAELRALVREYLAGIAPYLQALSWNPRLTSEDSHNLEEAASRIASSLDALAASEGQP